MSAGNGASGLAAQRGPLARLVKNPERSGGLPPYALTDQDGTIQRYVEPVPGIDLRPHVGQVVSVRHDTGRTLLASQLDLPPQALYSMLVDGDDADASAGFLSMEYANRPQQVHGSGVQLAQHADDDDTTVELLEDDEEMHAPDVAEPHEQATPAPMIDPRGAHQSLGPMMTEEGPAFGGTFGSAPCESGQLMPDECGAGPCPQCGRYHGTRGYEGGTIFETMEGANLQQPTHLFGDIEINFMRFHIAEGAMGKASEKYEFSPRFIVGFTGLGPLDGRVRYWIYGRETRTLNGDDDAIRLELDVLDVEATHQFAGRRSEVVLAAGFRLAGLELVDDSPGADNLHAGADLVGITMAADGRTRLASLDAGRLAWVYGGRFSILGGDWGGDDGHDLVMERVRDDNVVVHELYAGLELARCYRRIDLRGRLAFEIQNWHSDVLSDQSGVDSFGILGPSLRIGAQF